MQSQGKRAFQGGGGNELGHVLLRGQVKRRLKMTIWFGNVEVYSEMAT